MKFSVIIPLYNGAKLIEKTLDSVLSQTYEDYEIVLVNDGSLDNGGDIVKQYIAKHPRTKIVYVEQNNRGLGSARNTAIQNTSGDIIALIDQDDLWYPKKLEKVAEVFINHPDADLVCHNYNEVFKDGRSVLVKTGPWKKYMHRELFFGGNCLGTPAVAFTRQAVRKAGHFSEDRLNLHLLEDYEMWLRMALCGCKFVFIPDVLAEFRHHGMNNSESDVSKVELMCRSELNVLDIHFRLLRDKKYFDWYNYRRRKAICFYYAAAVINSSLKDPRKAFHYYLMSFVSDPAYAVRRLCEKVKRLILDRKGEKE